MSHRQMDRILFFALGGGCITWLSAPDQIPLLQAIGYAALAVGTMAVMGVAFVLLAGAINVAVDWWDKRGCE